MAAPTLELVDEDSVPDKLDLLVRCVQRLTDEVHANSVAMHRIEAKQDAISQRVARIELAIGAIERHLAKAT